MMSQNDMLMLKAAKNQVKRYHYGSLYYKSAVTAYQRKKQSLAQKYHCSVEAIEAEERKTI